MRIELKFTEQTARYTFHFLKTRYNSKLPYNQKNFEKLAKLAVLTESASQAKIETEKLEKLLPAILESE